MTPLNVYEAGGDVMGAPAFSDEHLASAICPDDPARGMIALGNMSAKERASLVMLEDLYLSIKLYEDGLGPKPTDAIVCGPNEIRDGRGPKARGRK